jgi:hypothetical protein
MEKDEVIHILAQAQKKIDENPSDAVKITVQVVGDLLSILSGSQLETLDDFSRDRFSRASALMTNLLKEKKPEVTRHDVAVHIAHLVETGTIPSYVGGHGSNPQQWVANNVIPHLSDEMQPFAYVMPVYEKSIPRLYKVIRNWRNLGYRNVELFKSTKGKRR